MWQHRQLPYSEMVFRYCTKLFVFSVVSLIVISRCQVPGLEVCGYVWSSLRNVSILCSGGRILVSAVSCGPVLFDETDISIVEDDRRCRTVRVCWTRRSSCGLGVIPSLMTSSSDGSDDAITAYGNAVKTVLSWQREPRTKTRSRS